MKKALLTLLVLGFAQISFGAQPMAKVAGQLLKKTFSGTMTGLHWMIAAGLPISYVIFGKIGFEKSVLFSDSNHHTTYFIATELLKRNIKIDGVKILPISDDVSPIMTPIKQNILVSPFVQKEITAALENNDQLTQQKYRSVLEHNAGGIKHNDFQWICAAGFTMPFITHITTKSLYNNLAYAKKAKPFLLQQCAKIPTGFGKLALSIAAIKGISNYQIQRNDNEITNDLDTLIGLKTHLTELINLAEPTKFNQLPYPLNTTKKRIEKLDKRIAELKKNQKTESNS